MRTCIRLSLVFFLAGAPISLPALSEAPAADVGATAVSFPVKSLDLSYQLRISGPGGKIYEERFAPGSTPSFALYDARGDARRDGTYVWELVTLAPQRVRGRDQPATPVPIRSGAFSVRDGVFVAEGEELARPGKAIPEPAAGVPRKDFVIADDLIVQGSECLGLDCVNGEVFDFDTLRFKENNLRLHFLDTSTAAGFPTNDWRLVINDSNSGGASYVAIEDSTAVRQVFRVDAGAPANALRVSSAGRLGVRTATPGLDVHVASGNTPALRLEQNGSSGFTAQTWDVAANETNFFVRDATGGSRLPFRIQPGAPSNSLFVKNDGKVGMGTSAPASPLHLVSGGPVQLRLENTADVVAWNLTNSAGGQFRISDIGDPAIELTLTQDGNLTILGEITTASGTSPFPDYVFEESYPLMPLDELAAFVAEKKHLPNMPSAEEVKSTGQINLTAMQLRLLEKIEELTLYTLEQQKTILEQNESIRQLQLRLALIDPVDGAQ